MFELQRTSSPSFDPALYLAPLASKGLQTTTVEGELTCLKLALDALGP